MPPEIPVVSVSKYKNFIGSSLRKLLSPEIVATDFEGILDHCESLIFPN